MDLFDVVWNWLMEQWNWLMTRSYLEVLLIVGVAGGIIIQITVIIVRWLKERKNRRNGRNGRS
jgi:hypothetical protein